MQFAATYAEGFRYIAEWNCWMLWNGTYWKQEKTLQAFDKARVLCRQAEDAKAKIVAAVVTLARADRAIAATEDQWNTKLFALNTPAEEKDQ